MMPLPEQHRASGRLDVPGGDDIGLIAEVGVGGILTWTFAIVLAAFVSYWVYRAMERPRLVITQTDHGPRALRRDVILYAITIPVLITAWVVFFAIILLAADNRLDALQLITIPAAIVVAARVLAHVNPTVAHEVAKVVPLAIITVIIIGGQLREETSLISLLDQLEYIEVTWPALLFVLLIDYLLTTLWYWVGVRWWSRRSPTSAQ
jgi:hypothetical protein